MGENSKNYLNGKIYCIRNRQTDDTYIGSTTQALSKRMTWHKEASKKKQKKHYKLYQKMNEIGFENFYIELVEEHPCDNVEQLRRREGEIMRQYQSGLNSKIAGRTETGWREDNEEHLKEHTKKYREENKEALNKWKTTKVQCECGGKYTLSHKTRHFKSKKHQNYLNNDIENVPNIHEETNNEQLEETNE